MIVRRRQRGFGLIDVMVAMAIMFSGAYVMISVLPRLVAAANQRSTQDSAYLYASAKMEEILSQNYSSVVSSSGNFNTLMAGMPDLSKFTWQTIVVEEAGIVADIPSDLRKKVTLNVIWASGSTGRDTYIFYMADMNDD